MSPGDVEAWAELSSLYLSQGLYSQAVFALEEVLVVAPNAWNVSQDDVPFAKLSRADILQMHARLGEVLLMASNANSEGSQKYLAESVKRFARSVELCDDYLRGYYGLKTVRTPPVYFLAGPACSHVIPRLRTSSCQKAAGQRSKKARASRCPTRIPYRSSTRQRRRSSGRSCDGIKRRSRSGRALRPTRSLQLRRSSTSQPRTPLGELIGRP